MVRYKESIDQATERILQGELGRSVHEKKVIGSIEFLNDGPWLHSISIVFLTTLRPGKTQGSFQAQEIRYFHQVPEDVHPIQGPFLTEQWRNFFK
jgi:ADP-ribose pyrophosphatase YjhB (NUDIX family)